MLDATDMSCPFVCWCRLIKLALIRAISVSGGLYWKRQSPISPSSDPSVPPPSTPDPVRSPRSRSRSRGRRRPPLILQGDDVELLPRHDRGSGLPPFHSPRAGVGVWATPTSPCSKKMICLCHLWAEGDYTKAGHTKSGSKKGLKEANDCKNVFIVNLTFYWLLASEIRDGITGNGIWWSEDRHEPGKHCCIWWERFGMAKPEMECLLALNFEREREEAASSCSPARQQQIARYQAGPSWANMTDQTVSLVGWNDELGWTFYSCDPSHRAILTKFVAIILE